jgi:hypothetical protein
VGELVREEPFLVAGQPDVISCRKTSITQECADDLRLKIVMDTNISERVVPARKDSAFGRRERAPTPQHRDYRRMRTAGPTFPFPL